LQILNLTLAKFENTDIKSEIIELDGVDRNNAEKCIYIYGFHDASEIKDKTDILAAIAKSKALPYALIDGFYPFTAVLEVKLRSNGVLPLYPLLDKQTRINIKDYQPEVKYLLIGFIEGVVKELQDGVSIYF
jgi:hypothetical protein